MISPRRMSRCRRGCFPAATCKRRSWRAKCRLGPKLIVAVQPTRGLDVGAIEAVQHVLLRERENGTAILLISEELEELLSLSDRIIGVYEGRNMGELAASEATLTEIGLMMAGTPRGADKVTA